MTSTLFVDKGNGTFADPLLAYGLAAVARDVLERVGGRGEPTVYVFDRGSHYQLDLSLPLDDARLVAMPIPYMPAVVLRTAKNASSLPADLPPQVMVDYETERDRRAQFFEVRKKLSAGARSALWRNEDHPELAALQGLDPHEHWDVFRAINPASLIGYNKLMTQWWTIQPALPEVLALVCDLFAQTPNDLTAAMAAWRRLDKQKNWKIKQATTAQQIFNPSQGKGQNRPKADRLAMDNIKNAFWLIEWLKAVGFYRAALTKQLLKAKDRKTYVVCPLEIDLRESSRIMQAFRASMVSAETAVRSDVLASLRYTRALIEFSQRSEGSNLKARLFQHRRPSRVVAGLASAFYKSLGNAVATMNLSFIGLPGWIRVENEPDLEGALSMLAEHEAIVRQFDESHGDAYDLLIRYRNFVSGTDLRPFFAFAVAYSSYLISQRERPNGRARQFQEENLRRLIVNAEPKLSRILDTPGFKNVAEAIRQSTVVAQYRKKAKGDRRYDVRYGLGAELARKSTYPVEFITALSDFLHRYNSENAQVMENRAGPYRRSIRTSDIDDVVSLVDEFGAPLVCNLLVAYGYARSPWEPKDTTEPRGEESIESEDDRLDEDEEFDE